MKQGGSYAVSSGRILEGVVEHALVSRGFSVASYKEWRLQLATHSDLLLIKNVPYEGLYEHASTTEFLVLSKKHAVQTRIECKWQQSAGSVDEKFPYLFLNCSEKMHDRSQ